MAPDRFQFWTEEVQRRAGGSLRLQVTNHWRDQEFAFDEATIADVQACRVQLVKVNARAYDIGRREQLPGAARAVPGRQPDAWRRGPEATWRARCSWDQQAWPGWAGDAAHRPAQPPGLSRPLVAVKDYRGTRIGTREGEVAKATSTPRRHPPRYRPGGPLQRLDRAELDLSGINQAKVSPPWRQPVEDRR